MGAHGIEPLHAAHEDKTDWPGRWPRDTGPTVRRVGQLGQRGGQGGVAGPVHRRDAADLQFLRPLDEQGRQEG